MMLPYFLGFGIIILILSAATSSASDAKISAKKSLVWGPGLRTDFVVPVRYFFIQTVDTKGKNITESRGENTFSVTVFPKDGSRARIWVQTLDRHDGSYIVRFKLYDTCTDLQVDVKMGSKHVASSPYHLLGKVFHEHCDCPTTDLNRWAEAVGCPATYPQIERDLSPFSSIDMVAVAEETVQRFNLAGRHSLCHYKIIDNKIYRKTYGEHVGFKMFMDAILTSITRKVRLPDVELFVNLGDWPLEVRPTHPLPIFSWCGSNTTMDIVMPTYDITEATLEMMGRVSLDMFSVQANTGPRWEEKTEKAFWRGRDSCRERLQLAEMSQHHPDLVDAALTNMFFFPKDEKKYGKVVKAISFFDFFKYKYQLNIDGTVAAYRLPYLMAGDAVILKQDSPYYEHFYHELVPYTHYIPIERDLSDLRQKIRWAKENDDLAKQIAQNAQSFSRNRLNPEQILCYHVRLFEAFSKLLKSKPQKEKGFELVEQPSGQSSCSCPQEEHKRSHAEL